MKVEVIVHESGDLLPILLDCDDMPIPAPNEFIISRRALSPNTLTKNLRELSVFYKWLEKQGMDLDVCINSRRGFTEAEIKGSLIEFLRQDHESRRNVKKLVVTPNTFNQRLLTVRQYLVWVYDIAICSLPKSSEDYASIVDDKSRLLELIESSFIQAPAGNRLARKGLKNTEVDCLIRILDPKNRQGFGKFQAVKYRNYIMTMIMLYYGLRPGELLSLRVQDIEIGAISCIRVVRRAPDIKDERKPRPQIKRNGRVLPIEDSVFAKVLDQYILHWRELLEEKSDVETDYLILSDEGEPLSQSSITQFYQLLRKRYPRELPKNLTAKSLRHTFSSEMEKVLRRSGMDEDKRKQALAYLRGDSSLSSQDVYIAQEVEESAKSALQSYQRNLIQEDLPW